MNAFDNTNQTNIDSNSNKINLRLHRWIILKQTVQNFNLTLKNRTIIYSLWFILSNRAWQHPTITQCSFRESLANRRYSLWVYKFIKIVFELKYRRKKFTANIVFEKQVIFCYFWQVKTRKIICCKICGRLKVCKTINM